MTVINMVSLLIDLNALTDDNSLQLNINYLEVHGIHIKTKRVNIYDPL